MRDPSDKMPAELAKELRTLAHDLSNALETIVQATYLISQSRPPESSRRWVELIDRPRGKRSDQPEVAAVAALKKLTRLCMDGHPERSKGICIWRRSADRPLRSG